MLLKIVNDLSNGDLHPLERMKAPKLLFDGGFLMQFVDDINDPDETYKALSIINAVAKALGYNAVFKGRKHSQDRQFRGHIGAEIQDDDDVPFK